MKYLLKYNDSIYSISNSIATLLKNSGNSFQLYSEKKRTIFILNDSNISLFQTLKKTSKTHFYAILFGKKCRINKHLFTLLNVGVPTTRTHTSRDIFDKYYTKSNIAQSCISTFIKSVKVFDKDLIVEPSAGNGSFLKPLMELNCRKIFLDIAPEHNCVKKADFLKWKPPVVDGKIHVIGNPPFGKQSALCHAFIKHATKFADTIGFILPISFKKISNIKKIPIKFHLLSEQILQPNSFVFDGVDQDVPCVFQIWCKKSSDRVVYKSKLIPRTFSFVSKNESNVAIVRVGSATGAIKLASKYNWLLLNKNTHYFVKVEKRYLQTLSQLKCVNSESSNWVMGAKSISKSELIPLLDSALS